MANRRVQQSGKDRDGDITALCGSWGRTAKQRAIAEIENRVHVYYTQDRLQRTARVIVVNGRYDKHLRTDPNSECSDNLDNLPNC